VKRRPAVVALVALAVLAVAGVLLSDLGRSTTPTPPPVDRPALLAYEGRLLPLVQDGGRVVQQGMKPALDDLRYKHIVPAPVIAQEGDGWIASLETVQTKVRQVAAPDGLTTAHQAFLQALEEYLVAAKAFRAAALAPPGAARERQIADGVRHAEHADHTYDRGAAILQRVRRSLGLPADPNFPGVPDD
jgi:hypothetical protein